MIMNKVESVASDEYNFEMIFALIVTILIYNIFKIVQIHYGDAVITRITTRPYKITMVLLIVMLCEISYNLVIKNIVYAVDFHEYISDITKRPFFIFLLDIPYQLKQWLVMCFFFSRTFETQILSYFMRYQGRLKLQNLELARDQYQKWEKIYSRIYVAQCVFISIFPSAMTIVSTVHVRTEEAWNANMLFFIYWILVMIFILAYYNATVLSFM